MHLPRDQARDWARDRYQGSNTTVVEITENSKKRTSLYCKKILSYVSKHAVLLKTNDLEWKSSIAFDVFSASSGLQLMSSVLQRDYPHSTINAIIIHGKTLQVCLF